MHTHTQHLVPMTRRLAISPPARLHTHVLACLLGPPHPLPPSPFSRPPALCPRPCPTRASIHGRRLANARSSSMQAARPMSMSSSHSCPHTHAHSRTAACPPAGLRHLPHARLPACPPTCPPTCPPVRLATQPHTRTHQAAHAHVHPSCAAQA